MRVALSVCACAIMLAVGPARGVVWNGETVDTLGSNATSLAVDRNGTPHIAYHYSISQYNTGVRYAKRGPAGGWTVTRVDSSAVLGNAVGGSVAIGLDSSGNPWIAYRFETLASDTLKVAHWNGSGWDISRVDDRRPKSLTDCQVIVDRANRPHVIYRSQWVVCHAALNGSAWDRDTVCYIGFSGPPEAVLDSQDRLHVGVCNYDTVFVFNGPDWDTSLAALIDNGTWVAVHAAIDGNDRIHLAYSRVVSAGKWGICCSRQMAAGGWTSEVVDSVDIPLVPTGIDIAADAQGSELLVYPKQYGATPCLVSATGPGGWQVALVDSSDGFVDADLVLGPGNVASLCFPGSVEFFSGSLSGGAVRPFAAAGAGRPGLAWQTRVMLPGSGLRPAQASAWDMLGRAAAVLHQGRTGLAAPLVTGEQAGR